MSEKMTLLQIPEEKQVWLKGIIRDIPDFPKPGIVFKDMTPLLKDGEAFAYVVNTLADAFKDNRPTYIAGIEARGFILGPTMAHRLGVGFIPIRKPGKLPHKVESQVYELEYGTDKLEIHVDAVKSGDRVVIVDDLLATGGTAEAAYRLLDKIGANVVGIGFVVELSFLNGKSRLPSDVNIHSVITY